MRKVELKVVDKTLHYEQSSRSDRRFVQENALSVREITQRLFSKICLISKNKQLLDDDETDTSRARR